MQIVLAIISVLINCILYMAFGSFICVRTKREWSATLTIVIGFFAYYFLFACVCLPIMLTYRPLSLLTTVWMIFALVVLVLSIVLFAKQWVIKAKQIGSYISSLRVLSAIAVFVILLQVILVTATYNFTLDAAYYVANVTTSVDTNMINVYDPFTGAWQDHFELRYAFATYSIYDALVCQVLKIAPLVETKTVMSSIVIILANLMYLWICRFMWGDKKNQLCTMYLCMVFVNLTFITLYTPSNFLMTRTYEGKSIVGNIAIIAIFAIYLAVVRYGMDNYKWIMLLSICLGTVTVSSTANMVIPAQLCILFVPYMIKNREYKIIPKLLVCIVPELVMMMIYVLYVKGYFAIYTYPRY